MKLMLRTYISTFATVVGIASSFACSARNDEPKSNGADASAAPLDSVDDSALIPCAPRLVLERVCQKCHARPTKNGAPFALERRSDFFADYYGDLVRDLAVEQVQAGRMPLTPVTIGEGERDALLEWLNDGAPAAPATDCPPWQAARIGPFPYDGGGRR